MSNSLYRLARIGAIEWSSYYFAEFLCQQSASTINTELGLGAVLVMGASCFGASREPTSIITSVSAPIFTSQGDVVGVVNVYGPSFRFHGKDHLRFERLEAVVRDLGAIASLLQQREGHAEQGGNSWHQVFSEGGGRSQDMGVLPPEVDDLWCYDGRQRVGIGVIVNAVDLVDGCEPGDISGHCFAVCCKNGDINLCLWNRLCARNAFRSARIQCATGMFRNYQNFRH